MTQPSLFEHDFDQLEPGQSFSTRGRTITESDLVAFAGLTGDHHPLHTDAEWAGASRFGCRIAHGMMLLSYSVGLAPIDPETVLALRGFDRVTFKRPVRLGDTIHLDGKVEEVKPLDEQTGSVRVLWKVLNQEDRLVLRAVAEILWRREAGRGPGPGPPPANETTRDARDSSPAPAPETATEPVYL